MTNLTIDSIPGVRYVDRQAYLQNVVETRPFSSKSEINLFEQN